MNEDEKLRASRRLHSYLREWKGAILTHVACIERDIALFLSAYFGKKEKEDFLFSDVFMANFFSFESKIRSLEKVMKRDFQFCLDQYPGFIADIRKVQRFRNIVAHSTIDVSEEALARDPREGVGFLSFKDGCRSVEVYGEAQFQEINGLIGNVSSELSTLLRFVVPKNIDDIPNK